MEAFTAAVLTGTGQCGFETHSGLEGELLFLLVGEQGNVAKVPLAQILTAVYPSGRLGFGRRGSLVSRE